MRKERRHICTDLLDIYYEESGDPAGVPVILLHGFPYDIHAFDEAVEKLLKDAENTETTETTGKKYRILVPWLRGYGPTRFLSEDTIRSGEQAALAADVRDFMDALGIDRAVLAGFDWGGRAACIVSALWPDRVLGLVSCGVGYNVQNPLTFRKPSDPDRESRSWYVYYFHTERGRQALTGGARDLTRFLWRTWSPTWDFTEETFLETAESFDNPDFTVVVRHSYMHRTGETGGDPRYADLEEALCAQPRIWVSTVILLGEEDTVTCPEYSAGDDRKFTKLLAKKILPGVGHNVPQEAPEVFAQAVQEAVHAIGNLAFFAPVTYNESTGCEKL